MKTLIKLPSRKSRLFPLGAAAVVVWLQGAAAGEIQFEPATSLFPGGPTQEAGPTLSSDGLTLYFQRGNPGAYDIWTATRSTRFGVFGAAVSLGPIVNSSSNDGGSSLSLDGLSLFFASNRPGGQGNHDLYVATRTTANDSFGTPVNLGAGVNSSWDETGPDISADGLALLFQSGRPGDFGQIENIYMATRPNTSVPFGAVENLGPTINFGGNTGQPGLSADGLSLFFIADSSPGASSGDIWVSTRASLNDPWGDPVNLGPTVNGPFQDDHVDIARDGLSIVFTTDTGGGFHMYEARVVSPPNLVLVDRPPPYPSPPTVWNFGIWQSSFSATDSDPVNGRQGARVYDVFQLSPATFPHGADIRKVNWEMAVYDFYNAANNPPGPLMATSYRVNFWANETTVGQSDQPGAQLFTLELPAASVQTVFKGNATDLPVPDGSLGKNYAFYHVSVDLPEPFHAAPDTSYWVSWMAFTPTFQPNYGSYTNLSDGAGGHLWQDRLDRDGNLMVRFKRLGNTMSYSLEGTATPPGFPAWIAGYGLTGPNAAPDADPDLDGMSNSLEDVLGGNPTISSTAGLPTCPAVGGNFVFTFNRADVSETPDVALAVQAGPDLVNWPAVYTIGPDTASSIPGVTITENGAAPDTITVTIPQGTAAIKFVRLTVTVTP